MFNKYLLISTLVCGLMSVSMGERSGEPQVGQQADQTEQQVGEDEQPLEQQVQQTATRIRQGAGGLGYSIIANENNAGQEDMKYKISTMGISTADDMGVDYTDKTRFTPGKKIGSQYNMR